MLSSVLGSCTYSALSRPLNAKSPMLVTPSATLMPVISSARSDHGAGAFSVYFIMAPVPVMLSTPALSMYQVSALSSGAAPHHS